MIFNFLRQFLKDDEFEKNKLELAETKVVLKEYKDFLQEQKESVKDEKEKVDPDFLALIWASIGFAFVTFGESAKSILDLQEKRSFPFYIWSAFALFSVFFIALNSVFALELTKKYATSKSNSGYVQYAYSIMLGALLLVAGVLTIALIK